MTSPPLARRHLATWWIAVALLPACAVDPGLGTDEAALIDDDGDPGGGDDDGGGGGGGGDDSDCDDGNACTTDYFLSGRCRHRARADGSSCADACTNGSPVCSAGVCVGATPISCDDGNACTDDYCDTDVGCVAAYNSDPCSDGSACTIADVCSLGVCTGIGSTTGDVVPPTIDGVAVSAPAPGAVLARTQAYYVTGNLLDVELTVSSCTYVTRVELGTSVLTTAPRTKCGEFDWPRDCEPNYYTIENETLNGDGSRRLRLRLHMTPGGTNGASKPVRIVATSALGEAVHELVLSRVAAVEPAIVGFTIAEAQLHNAFVAAMYQRFGDQGWTLIPPGSSDPHMIYGPDYNAMWMSVDVNGLRVHMKFEGAVPGCDTTVTSDSLYLLSVDNGTLTATPNLSASSVSVDIPWACDLVYDVVLGFFKYIVMDMAEESTAKTIDEQVSNLAEMLGEDLCGGSCWEFAVTTEQDALRIRRLRELPTIAIDVPYDPNGAKYPSPFGLPLSADENVVLTADNLVSGCEFPTSPGDVCFGVTMGPAGVPNPSAPANSAAAMPIPDPNVWDGTQWLYFEERQKARAELRYLARTPTALPRPDAPVGMLVAKLAGAGTAAPRAVGSGPCRIQTPVADLLGFGANDRTASGLEYGRGTRRVFVTFAPAVALIPPCVE